MRILLINQFFWPDPAPTGLLLADLAEELIRRGHRVDVVCSKSGYEVRGGDGPARTGPASKEQARTGLAVTLHPTPTLPFSRSRLGRLLSWTSFLLLAAWKCLTLPRYDLALAMTTPPALALAGLLQKWRGARFWIWEMDLYPDVATAVGSLNPQSAVARFILALMDWPRRRADGIITLGECMSQRLQHRVAPGRLHVAENWADGSRIQASAIPSPSRTVRVLYSGNMGMAHEIETIGQTISGLSNFPAIEFIIAGGGKRKAQLEEKLTCGNLPNVRFEGFLSEQEFTARLASAHIGLVTLHPDCSGVVVPSKIYALLAAGRPVLFIGPANATPARLIRESGCGWHVANGDAEAAMRILKHLAEAPGEIVEAGTRALELFRRRYEKRVGVARLVDLLE